MWLILAFLSAALLGCYDSFKKQALRENAVIPVLFLNTLFSSIIFLPFIVLSASGNSLDGSIFHVASGGWEVHRYVLLKAFIVLSSWILGYFGMKHLPLTIVGPINATRPVMVLVGALLVFGERLNGWQWMGVLLAVLSFQEGGYRLQARPLDMDDCGCCSPGCCQRPVRQIPYGACRERGCRTGPYAGAVVVQHLPMRHDAGHARYPLVAQAPRNHAVPLALEHHLRQHLPVNGRLRVLLFAVPARCHD